MPVSLLTRVSSINVMVLGPEDEDYNPKSSAGFSFSEVSFGCSSKTSGGIIFY